MRSSPDHAPDRSGDAASNTSSSDRAGLRIAREAFAALLALTLLVAVVTWPIVSGLGDIVVGGLGGDSTGGVWWLWSLQHEGGFHLTGTTLHTLTGAPLGWEEGNGLNIQWALPYYPAYLAAKVIGEVAAYNLVILTGLILSGAAMYALARYLGCHAAVSAWAALVYVMFPWHLERVVHASLVHLEALPLLLLALVALARTPAGSTLRARVLLLGAVGAANLAAWMSSGYYGMMALAASTVFAGTVAVLDRGQSPGARLGRFGGVVCSAGAAAAIVYVVGALGSVGNTIEAADRSLSDLDTYGLRLWELVVPAADSALLGVWAEPFREARLHGSNPTETSTYVGVLTIVLAATWFAAAWRARSGTRRARTHAIGIAAVLVVAVLLALPSPFLGFDLMPSRIVFEHVTSAIRAPSRWIVLVMTALVPLAALGLQVLWQAIPSSGRHAGRMRYGLVLAASAISFLELYGGPVDPTHRASPVPALYEAVAATPDGTLAEYPLRYSDIYLFWQRAHGRPLVNVRRPGTAADDLARRLVDPSSPGTAGSLAALGVTAIVTRPDALAFRDEGVRPVPDASWGPGYALVRRYPDGSSVWRVTAEPAPVVATLPSTGFDRPESRVDGTVWYRLLSESGHIDLRADTEQVVRLHFDVRRDDEAAAVRLRGAEGELQVASGALARVSTLVRVAPGCSRLTIETGSPGGVALSAPWAVPARDDPPALVAEPGC
jgi:hypothetical protein